MKKIIYLSIVLVTLSLSSCRNQDDMVQLSDIQRTKVSNASATNSNNAESYASFNSSAVQQGDPAHPPRD